MTRFQNVPFRNCVVLKDEIGGNDAGRLKVAGGTFPIENAIGKSKKVQILCGSDDTNGPDSDITTVID